jgi:hypothetical protein
LAVPGLGFAATKPSKLSEYAGNYQGTGILSGGSTTVVGTTQGSFTASKKRETGSLSLSSLFNVSGALTPISETYTIRKHTLSYLLVASGSAVTGSGRVNVSKKRISYSALIPVPGSTYVLSGTMTLNKRRLTIIETLVIGGTTNVFSYTLTRRGKK